MTTSYRIPKNMINVSKSYSMYYAEELVLSGNIFECNQRQKISLGHHFLKLPEMLGE
jgi:hypothetical protein